MKATMSHASEHVLALYAGNELSWFERLRVGIHLRVCGQCRSQVQEFVEARVQVKELATGLPDDLNWERLASEMKANIHLGLSAGECVASPVAVFRTAQLTGWRPALVLGGAVLVVAMAWWSNSGSPYIPTNLIGKTKAPVVNVMASGVLLETSSSAIKVTDNGRVLSLRHPEDRDVVFTVSLQGSVRARYVDSESGQVTINNAYVQ